MEMPILPALLASSRGGALVVAGPILAIILFNVGAGGHSSIQRLLRSVFFGLLAGLAATFILTRADEDMPRIAAVFLAAFLLAAAVQWGLFGFARSTVGRREKEGRKDVGSLWIAVAPQVMALLALLVSADFFWNVRGGRGAAVPALAAERIRWLHSMFIGGEIVAWAYVLWWGYVIYGKVFRGKLTAQERLSLAEAADDDSDEEDEPAIKARSLVGFDKVRFGLTQQEVERILGRPDSKRSFTLADGSVHLDWRYEESEVGLCFELDGEFRLASMTFEAFSTKLDGRQVCMLKESDLETCYPGLVLVEGEMAQEGADTQYYEHPSKRVGFVVSSGDVRQFTLFAREWDFHAPSECEARGIRRWMAARGEYLEDGMDYLPAGAVRDGSSTAHGDVSLAAAMMNGIGRFRLGMTRAEVRAIGIQPDVVISEEQHSSDGPAKVTRDEEWHYVGLGLEVYFSGESELRVEFVSCTSARATLDGKPVIGIGGDELLGRYPGLIRDTLFEDTVPRSQVAAVLGAVANKLKVLAGRQRKRTVESNARYEWNEKGFTLRVEDGVVKSFGLSNPITGEE